ncbi:MAG: glycoside hydrolase family 13 protein [Oscillospiraceae bacterium]
MIFDPRNKQCKKPTGAVPAGTRVRFALRPDRAEGFSRASLTARFEQREDETVTVELPWRCAARGTDVFAGTLDVGGYVGLVWYSLRLEGFGDRLWQSPEYQLTVYDPADPPPTWFGEGVSYQIFPDRFCRLSVPDPAGMVGGRTVHQSWDEKPEYRPNEHGEIRNRDFFGGSLAGVQSRLPYLKELGVDTLYFCPIFEAAENHRYGTGDYEKIDPMLGTNEDFSALCAAAHKLGMRILLDGVFNHTGYVSRYFNGDGSYPTPGATQSQESPYYPWFRFSHWPDHYESWWGIYSLPAVEESCPSYVNYIAAGEDSIVRRWLRTGADGWRLDVADELPDEFLHTVHTAARSEKPDAVIIGEVWEDGSNKMAYGVRRKHIWGGHCDGLMNYPFRTALLSYLLGGRAEDFKESMETLRDHYPAWAFYSAMNTLGTHDTPRILTLLGEGGERRDMSRDWRSAHRLSPEQRERAAALLKLGAVVLYAFPGSPTVYYGDEAGMEGFEDPFNRRTFPWGQEDKQLFDWFAALGRARHQWPALRTGELRWVKAEGPVLAFVRGHGKGAVLAAANRGDTPARFTWHGRVVTLPPLSARLWGPDEP